jgi:hypothetical protein
MLQQMDAARNPRHEQMLKEAIAEIDSRLAKLQN